MEPPRSLRSLPPEGAFSGFGRPGATELEPPRSLRSLPPERAAAPSGRAAPAKLEPNSRRRSLGTLALAAVAGPVALLGAGCGTAPTVADYRDEKPALDLKAYLNGRLRAHGMFSDRSGRVVRRFVVEMEGRWTGDDGVLDEQFTYQDGSRERRVWRLRHHGNGRYTGRADDVVGEATGQSAGNAFQWRYTLRLPVDGRTWEVDFDDWMLLIDDQVLLNRARMSKFGIHLGEVQLVFNRLQAPSK